MEKLKQFITTDQVPRGQVIVFGVVVIGIGWAQSEYYYQKALTDSRETVELLNVRGKLLEIQQQSTDFQVFAGAFVSAVLENTDDIKGRRSALVDNILAQDAAVDVSSAIFDEPTAIAAAQYRRALREMRDAIGSTSDVVSMSGFWTAASNLLMARNTFLEALEQQVQMPAA